MIGKSSAAADTPTIPGGLLCPCKNMTARFCLWCGQAAVPLRIRRVRAAAGCEVKGREQSTEVGAGCAGRFGAAAVGLRRRAACTGGAGGRQTAVGHRSGAGRERTGRRGAADAVGMVHGFAACRRRNGRYAGDPAAHRGSARRTGRRAARRYPRRPAGPGSRERGSRAGPNAARAGRNRRAGNGPAGCAQHPSKPGTAQRLRDHGGHHRAELSGLPGGQGDDG